ncbi:uncharacterized protein AC631_01807 [Debaryomyces fabryi]|uniref:Uncharacterized protein n=1 Tax=Debaryomyces fabryi TaxID=58627 RepID=A0A0V1Q235_9ASCO|nr:uncharacterized protein AC631_01807 [Debaryomyces fabryi]KSA02438.1 hypothetical protein AC631_01807 [Debaryomyces fabryi]CUM54807.1 unnamed protein product [Debaryomyces fabryi]
MDELMGFGSKKDDFLEDPGSCRTTESDGRNSQPKMHRMAEDKQHHFGISFLKSSDYEPNLNMEDGEDVFFGGFHDGPVIEGIGGGLGHKSYCKRKLELSHELNKRQRCMDPQNDGKKRSILDKVSHSLGIWDKNLGIGIGCKRYGRDGSPNGAEINGDLYNNPKIFKEKPTHNTALSRDKNALYERYDVVTGTILPLGLKDVEKKSEPSLTFPLADSGNYLLGEPLRDIINDTSGINREIEPLLVNYNYESNLLLIGNYDKENVIDPRVIFKFEANPSHLRDVKKIYNNRLSIPLPQENNTTLACLDMNKNAKLDTSASKKFPLIAAVDENTIPPPKKTIMLTYPTPDPLPERESGAHIYNKGGLYTNNIIEYDQKEIKKTDETKAAAKNKPKISQKLLYIHNLSRSSNTKIDETVAYLHYKLRSYENMAVLTRIRNILQSHQLNLIGICGQLGIPELLVPRRTN